MALKKKQVEEPTAEMFGDDAHAAVSGIGHNQGPPMDEETPETALTKAARDKLKQVVAKIERLEEDKRAIAGDIKDVYAEAKSMGYDTKTLRSIVRIRRKDRQAYEEEQALLETYGHAIGMFDEFYD